MDKEDAHAHALLRELLSDPLLKDVTDCLPFRKHVLPPLDADSISALLEETECMIQAELGGACRIKIEREDHEPQNIAIRLDATVKDLKKIIQKKIEKSDRESTQRLRQELTENRQSRDNREVVPENGAGQIKSVEGVSETRDSRSGSKIGSSKVQNLMDNAGEDMDATELSTSPDRSIHVALPRYTNINWKYIWRSSCLMLDGTKILDDDKTRMREVGLRNGSVLRFVPYSKKRARV